MTATSQEKDREETKTQPSEGLKIDAIAEAIEKEKQNMKSKDSESAESEASSSESERMDGEGLLAINSIEKLTSGNLDIKPLTLNFGAMRQFVHTPKNGIRVPTDMNPLINTLKNDGFLVFAPEGRPA